MGQKVLVVTTVVADEERSTKLTIPTTLEEAVAALEDERKRHSATRKESIQRRTRLKGRREEDCRA